MTKKELLEYLKDQPDDIIIKINHDNTIYYLTDVQKIEDISIGEKPYILISTEEE